MAQTKVTPYEMNYPVMFSAYTTANTSLPQNTWTKVVLSNENFDVGNNFDAVTNYRLVAPVSGYYMILGSVRLSTAGISSGAAVVSAIYKNGSAVRYSGIWPGNGNSTSQPAGFVSDVLYLASGDYVELYAQCTDATTRTIGGGQNLTWMSGYLVQQA